jgi:hypothetical protein
VQREAQKTVCWIGLRFWAARRVEDFLTFRKALQLLSSGWLNPNVLGVLCIDLAASGLWKVDRVFTLLHIRNEAQNGGLVRRDPFR